MEIDYNALAQATDTSWGRSSTPKAENYSVKFSIQGNTLVASFISLVSFTSEKEMIHVKRRYAEEASTIISEVVKLVKSTYKSITGDALPLSETASNDSVEVVGSVARNPRRMAYYRRKVMYDIG